MGIWTRDVGDPEADFRLRHVTVGIWLGFALDLISIEHSLAHWSLRQQLWFVPVQFFALFLPLLLRLPVRRLVVGPRALWYIGLGTVAVWALEAGYVLDDGHAGLTYPLVALIGLLYVYPILPVSAVFGYGVLIVLGQLGVKAVEGQMYPGAVVETTSLMATFVGLITLLAFNRRAQRRLQCQAGERAQLLGVNASDMVIGVDAAGLVSYQSPSITRILGYEAGFLLGQPAASLSHPTDLPVLQEWFRRLESRTSGDREWVDARIQRADGTWRYVEIVGSNELTSPGVAARVLRIRDISDRKAHEEQLSYQAFHDPLTGLANRALFRDRVKHAVARQARSGEPIGLFMIDLDDFKLVNDGLGHSAGDELLVEMAARISGEVRAGDTVARLGGDEFGVLIEKDVTGPGASGLAERLIHVLRAPTNLVGQDIYVGASVGVAICQPDPESQVTAAVDELLRDADVAMYVSKAAGKNSYTMFDPAMYADLLREANQRTELEQAFLDDQFVVHYQPIVELPTGRVTGLEALIRWNHPTEGLRGPDSFIPLAELTGLIIPMGRWVLREACRQTRRWQLEVPGAERLRISVNLSPRQFQSPALVADVDEAMRSSGIDPRTVGLEITESMLMSDTDATIVTLNQLKALGVQLSVDDFGTGYSSLGYLKRFPVDILKIDKSFIDDIVTNVDDASLARTIVDLGRTLHLQTVAEGIESDGQFRQLQALGCDFGQGFLFAKPVSPNELGGLLRKNMAAAAVPDYETDLSA